MTHKISVIVAIYNVEEYLEECIQSIALQTYKNLEIILVNDGSRDNSEDICKAFCKKDYRGKYISKPNGGLSDARNAGIKEATGKYLCFVDGDDRLPNDSVEKLYSLAQYYQAQIVIGGFERFRDSTGEVFFSTEDFSERIQLMNQEELYKDFYRDGCQAWAVLYETEIHKDILFPKGEINEDEAIVFKLYERCKTAVVTNSVVYSYRNRKGSITTNAFTREKLIWQKHCKDNLEYIKDNFPSLIPEATIRYRNSILWSLSEIALLDDYSEYYDDIQDLMTELYENKDIRKACINNNRYRVLYYTLMAFGFKTFRRLTRIVRRKSNG